MMMCEPRVSFVLLGAAFALGSIAASAQPLKEIVVEAPRIQKGVAKDTVGASIDLISVTHRVSYSDIDISTSSGSQVLTQRVKDAAAAACKEIDKLYPLREPMPGSRSCADAAADNAMAQVKAAIAAAEKAKQK